MQGESRRGSPACVALYAEYGAWPTSSLGEDSNRLGALILRAPGLERRREKGLGLPPPTVAKATVQLAVDAREAGAPLPLTEPAWLEDQPRANTRSEEARKRFAGWGAPVSPPPIHCCTGDRQGTLTSTGCYSHCCLSKRNRNWSPFFFFLPQRSLLGTPNQQLPLLASHKQELRADVQNSPWFPLPCLPLFSFPRRILYVSIFHRNQSRG